MAGKKDYHVIVERKEPEPTPIKKILVDNGDERYIRYLSLKPLGHDTFIFYYERSGASSEASKVGGDLAITREGLIEFGNACLELAKEG